MPRDGDSVISGLSYLINARRIGRSPRGKANKGDLSSISPTMREMITLRNDGNEKLA